MTRHYSPRSFFRQVPIDLLARFSKSRGLGSELDFEVWLELPEERQRALELEFRQIFEMSSEKGTWAILDEARLRWRDDPDRLTAFIETLSSQPGHFHRAMATCLDHREWGGAPRGSVTPISFPIGASASTWDTGQRQPTGPASSTFPA